MEGVKKDDFVGRHLIVDASTYNRRNLTSTDTVFALLEALARNLDMTLLLPPIVCRYPFANDELATFCDDIELELARKMKELATDNDKPIDLSRLDPMNAFYVSRLDVALVRAPDLGTQRSRVGCGHARPAKPVARRIVTRVLGRSENRRCEQRARSFFNRESQPRKEQHISGFERLQRC